MRGRGMPHYVNRVDEEMRDRCALMHLMLDESSAHILSLGSLSVLGTSRRVYLWQRQQSYARVNPGPVPRPESSTV
jgi:hypothetical protein